MPLQRFALRAALACALAAPASLSTPAQARQITVILICATSVAPDNCTRDTASDVMIGLRAATPYGCLMGGLMAPAHQAAGGLLADHYALTRCEGRPD